MPNETGDASARPYRFVVNGVPIYINGWNWVPIDARYGVPRPERLDHLLDLAQRANVNLLRVWGGGLIESEAFYAGCDARGIMVWQEFAQSSSSLHNAPTEDPAFVELMRREAAAIVPLRRTHPSLALWCGGNELMDDADRPLDEDAPVLGALAAVVAELDPDRPFLPTSPSGRVAHNTLEAIARDPEGLHDVHGPWEHQGLEAQHTLYDAGTSLLASEFGVEGMTNRAALEASISPEHRWPATRDNPVYAHRGAWWNNATFVQEAFGGRLEGLDALRRASQLLQADGLRTAVEANRRRQWRSSGTIPWQLNEPFPNAWCTSAVDVHGRPKPAYFAVGAAYEPLHAAATFARQAWGGHEAFEATLWIVSARSAPSSGCFVARVVDAGGAELARFEREIELRARDVTPVGPIRAALASVAHDLFVLDLRLTDVDGRLRSANRYLLSRTRDLQPLLDLPAMPLAAGVERATDSWLLSLRNDGETLVAGLRVEDARPAAAHGWATPDADLLDLLPGESRTLTVRFDGVPPAERRLRIGGWNVEEREVG
ncbi:MAG TPA: glycoside hydrolase family 2 TIM barrel-domain containing protein [Solirubrobacteraceae bacterium]